MITAMIFALLICASPIATCFDIHSHSTTKGFHPNFLKQSEVKQNCIDYQKDMKRLGLQQMNYCNKELGTL